MNKYRVLFIVVLLFIGAVWPVRAADVRLPDGTQITLQLNDTLSTASNTEGDEFTAVVAMPVYFGDRIVIPKGSVVTGSVSRVLRPGRIKGKAILDLVFQTIQIPSRKEADIVATLIWIDLEGVGSIHNTQVGENRRDGEKTSGNSPQNGSALLPKVGARSLAAKEGKNVVIASSSRPAVFNSQGEDFEIHRGATMDILLDHPLILTDEESPAIP